MGLPDVYTPQEVADALQIRPSTVKSYARLGLIRGRKIGNLWRFSRKAVEEFIEGEECHSSEEAESGTPTNEALEEREYANLVALAKKRRRGNGMQGS